jgi:hypothetical protein
LGYEAALEAVLEDLIDPMPEEASDE